MESPCLPGPSGSWPSPPTEADQPLATLPSAQALPSLAWRQWGPALRPQQHSLRPADLTALGVRPPPCHKASSSHRQDWPLDLHPVSTPFPHCTPGPLASRVLPTLHQHPLAGPAAPRGRVSAGRKGCPTPATSSCGACVGSGSPRDGPALPGTSSGAFVCLDTQEGASRPSPSLAVVGTLSSLYSGHSGHTGLDGNPWDSLSPGLCPAGLSFLLCRPQWAPGPKA